MSPTDRDESKGVKVPLILLDGVETGLYDGDSQERKSWSDAEKGSAGGSRGSGFFKINYNPSSLSLGDHFPVHDFSSMKYDEKRDSFCMASAWRVISFFIVVFVLPTVLISLPLYARYHLYHARHLPVTETDTRLLDDGVSSFWCQGQRVSSNGTFDAFLLPEEPKLLDDRWQVTINKGLTLRHDDIEYWGVYLLEGSQFALSSCSRWPGGTLLVVKGEEDLRHCFYREDDIKDEISGLDRKAHVPTGTHVEKGGDQPVDDEEVKHQDEDLDEGGGEVFDDEEEVLVVEEEEDAVDEDTEKDDDEDDGDGREEKDDLVLKKFPVVKPIVPKKAQRKNKYIEQILAGNSKKLNKVKKPKKNKHLLPSGVDMRRRRFQRSKVVANRFRRSASESTTPMYAAEGAREDVAVISLDDRIAHLNRINDTLEVTTGNSSFSSSEEFLENCHASVLSISLNPYSDCRRRTNFRRDNPNTWRISINQSDYYYFIFTSDNSLELNEVNFKLRLDRVMYDVRSPMDTCVNKTECVFPLKFLRSEAVVVEMQAVKGLKELHNYEMTAVCQPRVAVYMIFILLVPFIILVFAFQ